MRRRTPGFYVSVRIHTTQPGVAGLPGELLDGPWPSQEAAEQRAREVREQRGREQDEVAVVRVERDGVTIVRPDAPG